MSLLEWFCSFSIFSSPSASSMNCAYWFTPPHSSLSASPTLRTFSRPSSATVTIRGSGHVSRSHSGLMHDCDTRYLICWCVPPEVAFEMAHAASFLMSNSAVSSRWMSGGTMLASTMAWIWSLLPAVMLEMVQHASFLMLFLWLVVSRLSRQGSAWQLMMICVWTSSPVTMLPTVRSAGMSTAGVVCSSSSTSLRHTPASMTAWILSLVPSER
mmetsp:Transcript_9395/g.32692  ORF Transcript_9395/g.32692 Transcript_9395/m.32692 type:complete len:213 (+) Transcript_9395:258-896(+)